MGSDYEDLVAAEVECDRLREEIARLRAALEAAAVSACYCCTLECQYGCGCRPYSPEPQRDAVYEARKAALAADA